MQNKNLLIVIAGVFLLGIGGVVLLGRQNTGTGEVKTSTPSIIENKGEVREVSVEGNEFSFSPKSVTITKGEKIRLVFKNIGRLPHNLSIDELGVATKTIPGGETDTIDFTAQKTGNFSFYCSVGNHRALGMEGSLEVR